MGQSLAENLNCYEYRIEKRRFSSAMEFDKIIRL